LSLAVGRSYVRHKVTMVFTFAFPLIFLVVFGRIFGGQHYGGRPFIAFIAPGVMCWAVANSALFGFAYTLVHWRTSEVLRLIRMTPTRVPTVLGARYLVAVFVGLAQAVFFAGIAALPFFGLHIALSVVEALPVLLLGISAFAALGLLVGTYAPSGEAIAAIANCILVPSAFVSGTFFPLEASPAWVSITAHCFPLRYMIQGVSGVLDGSGGVGTILVPCAALAGFTVLFGAFATRLFRWGSSE
jgi:ABC-2 type transport system permease protein